MPIIGKVNVTPFECIVKNMEVGASGYIDSTCIIITRKFLYLDLETEVTQDDGDSETSEEEWWPRLPIKRVGSGLTEEDFELDFSKSDQLDIVLYQSSLDIILKKDDRNFIIFKNFEIGSNNPGGYPEKKSKLEILQSQLQDAINEDTHESYEKAAKIREEINKEKKKSRTKNK